MTPLFGTSTCDEKFPNNHDDGHSRMWVQPAASFSDEAGSAGSLVRVLVERQRPGSSSAVAYLSRDTVHELVGALQRLLDETPAEPTAPECDYIIDRDGEFWVQANGVWYFGRTLATARDRAQIEERNEGSEFSAVLGYAPLLPIQLVTETRTVELPLVTA